MGYIKKSRTSKENIANGKEPIIGVSVSKSGAIWWRSIF